MTVDILRICVLFENGKTVSDVTSGRVELDAVRGLFDYSSIK